MTLKKAQKEEALRAASALEQRIAEVKQRMGAPPTEQLLPDVTSRLWSLKKSLEKLGRDGDPEFFRHFPVAAIAVLETHFKMSIAAIVDVGSPYLERGLELSKQSLRDAPELFPIVHRATASIGDLVAHVLPFNSLASLEHVYEGLLGGKLKLKGLISEAVQPGDLRHSIRDAKPVIENADRLWAGLAKTFARRHVLAHEAAERYEVSFDDAAEAVSSVRDFTMALDCVIWSTAWSDVPLTANEMNFHAHKEREEARLSLATELRKALRVAATIGVRAEFGSVHAKWRRYAQQSIRLESDDFKTGSIYPLINANAAARLYQARLADVRAWRTWAQPEERLDQ